MARSLLNVAQQTMSTHTRALGNGRDYSSSLPARRVTSSFDIKSYHLTDEHLSLVKSAFSLTVSQIFHVPTWQTVLMIPGLACSLVSFLGQAAELLGQPDQGHYVPRTVSCLSGSRVPGYLRYMNIPVNRRCED